jgi:transcriptional regulator with XRE-family HTH domain
MELSIQERLKDLRVERGLTLEQLAEQTHLSKSALGSYEAEDFKDISHYALIKLAKFYGVTADYLLGLSQTRNHPNADLAELRLSDDMIELLKSGRVDNSLLGELATHPDFPRLMADLEIYVNGVAVKQVQGANAIVDTMSATIMKQYNPGLTDPQLRQLITAHIDEDSFCRYVIQQDINKIALDLREAHKDDFFSVPEDNPLKGLLQTADEAADESVDMEQASMAFICKRLRLNYKKLSEEEKKWLKRISEKSDLLKNPNPQRGKRG